MAIFHPPCTYLCNSGVRWLYEKEERHAQMLEAAEFFKALLNAPIKHIAVENPRMHHFGVAAIGGSRQNFTVQPWMFGDWETKGTGFWTKNLPDLIPTYPTKAAARVALGLPEDAKPGTSVHFAAPGKDRWRKRSTTFPGIAAAAAEQWSAYVLAQLEASCSTD